MYAATQHEPRVLHALAGRVRLHVPAGAGPVGLLVARRLRELPWVRHAETGTRTGNLLVLFDPEVPPERVAAAATAVLADLRPRALARPAPQQPEPSPFAGSLRRALQAVLALRGGAGGVVSSLGVGSFRLALGALLDREAAQLGGLLAECALAAVAGSALSLTVAAVQTAVWLARPLPAPALPFPSAALAGPDAAAA